ncbi:Sulfotransferase family cytosolic 1B member 1, partial [Stylophora pistillata]
TTWISEILWQVYNDGAESTAMIFDRVSFLERDRLDVTTLPSPRLLHSHLTYDVIPKGKSKDTQCKYIYVARNPKDVAVSFYEFMKDYGSLSGFNGPWEFFARLFAEGKVVYGQWSDHVLGWWSQREDPNVLFLKYEDLIKDLHSNVCLIAKFLGKKLSEDTIKKISGQCSFNGMKKNMSNYWQERTAQGPKLLRKGKIGDWKNYFTQEQNERFENEVMKKLIGTGLKFDFED